MLSALLFFWRATRGYRLTPWRSPYVRWRVETYAGTLAASVTLGKVVRLFWNERKQFRRFLQWIGEIRELALPG